jgi:hypothetical protein
MTKLGQRVHLKFAPPAEPVMGTITRINGGRFRVSWDSEPNHRGRTIRHWYLADALKHGMEVGNPA